VQTGPDQQPSPFLVEDMRSSDPGFPQGRGRGLKPVEICRAALDELVGAYGVERLVLLIDGVDRLEPDAARQVLLQLLEVRGLADIAVVTAHGAITNAVEVLEHYRVMPISPVDVRTDEGLAFLVACVSAHLDDGEGAPVSDEVLVQAVQHSGGVIKTALTIVRDARSYAEDSVDDAALALATRDQVERLRRLLCDGDCDALAAADGTRGLEVPVGRKARLLDQGLLLEFGLGEAAVTRSNPLVARLIGPPTT